MLDRDRGWLGDTQTQYRKPFGPFGTKGERFIDGSAFLPLALTAWMALLGRERAISKMVLLEVWKMEYEESDFDRSRTGETRRKEEEDVGLDERELDRLGFLAEHPELSDPLFLGLQSRGRI